MAKNGLKWPKFAKICQKNGQKWPKMAKNGQKWPKLIWRIKSAITSASVNDTPVKLDNFAANSSLLSSKFSPKKEIYVIDRGIQQLRGPNFTQF